MAAQVGVVIISSPHQSTWRHRGASSHCFSGGRSVRWVVACTCGSTSCASAVLKTRHHIVDFSTLVALRVLDILAHTCQILQPGLCECQPKFPALQMLYDCPFDSLVCVDLSDFQIVRGYFEDFRANACGSFLCNTMCTRRMTTSQYHTK